LADAAPPVWRNEWKNLFVWYTTWDVGYQITELDVAAALELEDFHRGWRRNAAEQGE
jgi:pterin-4a-carbinolamine dehydratase